jgi:thiamine-phosphate pyrophosphorylase
MQLYAITDRSLLDVSKGRSGPEALGVLAHGWAKGGVDFIQVREKDLSVDELAAWSEAVVKAARGTPARVLINGTPRSAAAVGAHGVHLPAGWTAEAIRAARNVFEQHGAKHAKAAVVSIACHSDAEVVRARDLGADLALLSPVFEKRLRQPQSGRPSPQNPGAKADDDFHPERRVGMGLKVFRDACRLAAPLPVFALGGVTVENASACIEAGGAGVAAIRLFVGEGWQSLRRG